MSLDVRKTPSEGISSDGYITDQDCFSSVRYRTMRADINGCGWIAAYNLRHAFGQDPDWDTVRQEMDEMHTLRVPGPTLMRVMREYLSRYFPNYRETVGREAAAEAAGRSAGGIFRYNEGYEPHFVSFFRLPDGNFRFFNVADGLEDCIMSMQRFRDEHFLHGTVIALTVDEPLHERKDFSMTFKMVHENYNVSDLDRSIHFYEEALGLKEARRKTGDGYVIVFMSNKQADFELELTWLKDHPQKYDLGEEEFHLAFRTSDYDAAHKLHEEMGCICMENPSMGIYFITDPDGYWLEIIPERH